MYGRLPLSVVAILGTAGAGVLTVSPLIAAPGVGFALRLVGGSASRYWGSPASNSDLGLRDTTTNLDLTSRFAWSTTQRDKQTLYLPAPGLQLPANQGVSAAYVDGIGGDFFVVNVLYFIDDV